MQCHTYSIKFLLIGLSFVRTAHVHLEVFQFSNTSNSTAASPEQKTSQNVMVSHLLFIWYGTSSLSRFAL